MLGAPDISNLLIVRAKMIPILSEWTLAPMKDIEPIEILCNPIPEV